MAAPARLSKISFLQEDSHKLTVSTVSDKSPLRWRSLSSDWLWWKKKKKKKREREREEASDVFRVTMASATSGRTMNAKKQVTWAAPGTFAYAKAKRQRSFTPTYASKVLCQAANADEASNAAHILPRREVRTCFRSFTAFKHTQLTKTLFFPSPMLDEHLRFKKK